MHEILHEKLQGFDVFRYTDICFTFSLEPFRQITFRLIFCKENDKTRWLYEIGSGDLASLTVSVVSFCNVAAMDNSECETLFDKPPGALDLNAAEALYLYRTLIDIILQIAEIERI